MKTGLHTPYSFESRVFLHTSDAKTIDITSIINEIDIFEDMFSPTMTGRIVIGDAHDLLSVFKFHGNEFVEFSFDKASLERPLKKIFRIYKISERDFSTTLQNYTLYICSEEMVLSPQVQISKSYKGLTISDIVSDILKNILLVNEKKICTISKTEGIFDILIPRMNPFEAIQWLSTRAYTINNTLHFFFENRDGFNFVSYEELLKNPSYEKYTRNVTVSDHPWENYATFKFLRVVEDFDIMKASRYGSFSSRLNTLDIITKRYDTFDFNSVQFKNKGILNKEVTLNGFANRLGKTFYDSYSNMEKYVVVNDADPTTNPMSPESWLSQTASKMGQIHLFKMVGTIPGDFNMKVGNIIDVDMQEFTPQEADMKRNKTRSGRYLVSAVHQKMQGDIHTTILELLSDSISDYAPVAVNNDTTLNEIIRS